MNSFRSYESYEESYHEMDRFLHNPTESIPASILTEFEFALIALDGVARRKLMEKWTDEFIDLLLKHIYYRRNHWENLFNSLINATAFQVNSWRDHITKFPLFYEILKGFLAAQSPDSFYTINGNTIQECAAWILVNILQCYESSDQIPEQFFTCIPTLLGVIKPTSTPSFHLPQLNMKCFRCLCTLFSLKEAQKNYPTKYSKFLLLLEQNKYISYLLYEYEIALRGGSIGYFYPDPSDRALTIQYLTESPIGRAKLLEISSSSSSSTSSESYRLTNDYLMNILIASLFSRVKRSETETILLWSRVIQSLHNLIKFPEFHFLFSNNQMLLEGLSLIATQGNHLSNFTSFSLGMKTRRLAADIILSMKLVWEVERLFWIAHLKSSSSSSSSPSSSGNPKEVVSSPLSKIPSDLIRPILRWAVLLGSIEIPITNTIREVEFTTDDY